MQRISITNPQNVIDGTAKKYYFKLRNTGGPKGDKGDKGDTGATGPQGPQGNAATVSVGSTTTLPVGYDATVTNTGSIYNAVLDFGIPQGPQGPQGAKGDKGDTGAQGETGPRGPQGERGTNATVYVGTTTTTNPGTQARVYNSGTDSNAVLNFEIPRGDVGPMPELAQTTGTSTTTVMSQNATTVALNNGLAAKQDKLTAGSNITISGNTISATDTTYTAGNNVQINGTTISATDTTYTAGNGLNLNGTEFSADTDVLATKEDLESYYTKPETDNLLAPKLEAEVIPELPATGEEGKLYLTPKAHTTQTATGNPITATVAEEAGALESFQLDGDTFQQSYEGKNLFDIQDNLRASDSGLNFSFSNNELTVSGTPTRGWADVTSNFNVSLPAGQYTLSLSKQLTYRVYLHIVYTDATSADTFIIDAGNTSATATLEKDVNLIRLGFSFMDVGVALDESFSLQLEAGSTATSFEPYVGGQASPNPDYPQAIQTVTGEQTVEIVGKNLFNAETETSVFIDSSGNIIPGSTWSCSDYIKVSPNTTYVWYGEQTGTLGGQVIWAGYDSSQAFISGQYAQTNNTTSTSFTTGNTTEYIRVGYRNDRLGSMQLELGSTATTYAPYSKQTLPINLGSIELCKLGDYQDYIYKDGEDWKVHKAISSITLDGTEDWVYASNYNYARCPSYTFVDKPLGGTSVGIQLSNYFGAIYGWGEFRESTGRNAFYPLQDEGYKISIRNTDCSSAEEYKSWFAANKPSFYYPVETPTDTVITDQTLIAQLEAIRTASLENGTNTITNTATGTNLAGDMEIGYYGFAPRNRYDKWLWLDINNEYEQLNNPDTSSTLSTLSTRSLGATTEQPTVTRSLETETITLKKGEAEPIEDKTELPTILDDKTEGTEETETTEPEESDGTDER